MHRSRLTILVFALALAGAGCTRTPTTAEACEADADCREARRHANEMLGAEMARSRILQDRARLSIIEVRDGDAAAALYMKCTTEPPKAPAHQKQCADLLARIAKEDAAADAKRKQEAAQW